MKDIIICSYDEKFIPEFQTPGAVCTDLRIADDIVVQPGQLITVGAGIKTYLPRGWQAKVYARSGLPVKSGLMLANSVAIFDADYRGEYIMQFYNFTDKAIEFEKYTRLTQFEFLPYHSWEGTYGTDYVPKVTTLVGQKEWDNFANDYPSQRGEGRFHSTGR